MTFEEKFGPKFEIDSIVDENEIKKMEMRPLDNHGMQYELYSKGFYVYYFKRLEGNALQLFCCTSKESYYFSDNKSIIQNDDRIGFFKWLFA